MLVHWVVTYPPPLPPMRRHVSFLLLESQVMRRRSSTGVSLAISSEMTQPPSWTVDSIPNQHICPLLLEPPYEAVHFDLPSANGVVATQTVQVFERSVLFRFIGTQGNYSLRRNVKHPLTRVSIPRNLAWEYVRPVGLALQETLHRERLSLVAWSTPRG